MPKKTKTDIQNAPTQPNTNIITTNAIFVKPSHAATALSSFTDSTKNSAQKKKSSAKPHVLLWICTHGKGQRRDWTQKSLKTIGVYATKEDAQRKKEEVMMRYDNYGHGDIVVGGTWEDEIDLVIRPVEEVCL